MSKPDINLLAALDTLLAESSVAKAASRLGFSPSAMSHTLARLRAATGDKLLRADLHEFARPFPAHRWLRECVFAAVKERPSPS